MPQFPFAGRKPTRDFAQALRVTQQRCDFPAPLLLHFSQQDRYEFICGLFGQLSRARITELIALVASRLEPRRPG